MIKYVVKQNKNNRSEAFGKWYAFPVVEDTVDLATLAKHMEEHNTGFSEAMCLGMMTAMVKCIKEQLLAGKNVKIDNLAIFSVGIRNKVGADSEAEFSASANIAGVKLRARATGTLNSANLNSAASVRKASTLTVTVSGDTTQGGSSADTDKGGSSADDTTQGGGSTSGGSTSGESTSGGTTSGESTSGGTTSGDGGNME